MNYHDALNFLFDLQRFPPRPGIEATAALLETLDNPHEAFDAVQIAGSNGKGSTARMLESILQEAGLSVGLYTSPHLEDIRERIRIDGRPIREATLKSFVEETRPQLLRDAATSQSTTFFETVTAMALWAFEQENVDVAILEVGIGGRHDATSVVDPVAAAVTDVSLEHTHILGDSIEEIARDKANIAPDDGPLVTAASGTALAVIADVAPTVFTVGDQSGDDPDLHVQYDGRRGLAEAEITLDFTSETLETATPLLGVHQARNAGIAGALAKTAFDVDGTTISRGLRGAHWPGRFEIVDNEPLTVLDGAHNPGGCESVAATLSEFEYDELHVVFGALCEKDHQGMAMALPTVDHVYTCTPTNPRGEDSAVLAEVFERAGAGTVTTRGSVTGALQSAQSNVGPNDCLLVTGSIYTVAEARPRWSRVDIPKSIDTISEAKDTLTGAHVTDRGVYHMRGKAVHRVLKTTVHEREAGYLKEELLSIGGECAISGFDHPGERCDVVMMGTLAQFRSLAGKLQDQSFGLGTVGTQLKRQLGIGEMTPTKAAKHEGSYPWSDSPVIMGILNVTPDSFHDGGEYDGLGAAIDRAKAMVDAGAAIVDVGGESTRPGAEPVSEADECKRVIPVIEALAETDAMVSVDTRKAGVAREAIEAGADMINDVSGLADPGMRFVAAEYDVPICIMHSQNAPVDPSADPVYDDVVEDVIEALAARIRIAKQAGLQRHQLLVDPGLGFGKSASENFTLLNRLDEFQALGCPLLVGHSHKSMFDGAGYGPDERAMPTVAGTAYAIEHGADVIRVHDVEENVAALDTIRAITEREHNDSLR